MKVNDDSTEGRKTSITVDDFARLKKELDKITSLTRLQIFTAGGTGIILAVFFGFIGILLLGEFWGSIFASVMSALTIIGMTEGMRDHNFETHLESERDTKSEEIDDFIPRSQKTSE